MELLITGIAVIIAAGFRGITGFGYALVAAIGLSSSFSPSTMIPLILINDLVITGLILGNRKHGAIDRKVTPMLLLTGFIGALGGSFLASYMDETTIKLALSVVVCLSALLAMVHEPPRWLGHPILGIVAGLLVGLLMASFAVGGPLLAIWLLAGGTRREYSHGTLAVFFGAVDLFALISRIILGQIDPGLPVLLLTYMPLTLLGYAAGHWIGLRLDHVTWRRVAATGLILIAVIGAAQTIVGLAGGLHL